MRANLLTAMFAVAALSAPLAVGPAYAIGEGLPPVTSQAAVIAACTTPGATIQACQDAVAAYLGFLEAQGLSDADLQAAVVALVKELATTPGANGAVISAGIGIVVAEAKTPNSPLNRVLSATQIAALSDIQAAVINGPIRTAALPRGFSAT